ncbi:MAG: hypothetical protein O2983_07440 [Planctomycetota bacterium]|nr:hypothetical protein [Planctomycetota bacterium]
MSRQCCAKLGHDLAYPTGRREPALHNWVMLNTPEFVLEQCPEFVFKQ